MAKLGENTPHIIDATVDFMASSQAFREYLKKLPPDNTIPPDLTDEHVPLYIRRLEYYRLLYRPKQTESYWKKRLTVREILSRSVRRWTNEARQFFRLLPVTGFSASLSSSVTTF